MVRPGNLGGTNTLHFDPATTVLWYVAFLFSVVLHEAAHAWTAWRLGDATAYAGGQVSLDPRPHVRREPIGMVAAPALSLPHGGLSARMGKCPLQRILGTTRTETRRVDGSRRAAIELRHLRGGLRDPPSRSRPRTLVDGSGVLRASRQRSRQAECSTVSPTFLSMLFSLNMLLALFNLLPVPPLDGSAIVPLFLDDVNGRRYLQRVQQPIWLLLGLVVAMQFFHYVFSPFTRSRSSFSSRSSLEQRRWHGIRCQARDGSLGHGHPGNSSHPSRSGLGSSPHSSPGAGGAGPPRNKWPRL